MKTNYFKNKRSLQQIKNDFATVLGAQFAITNIYFLFTFTFSWHTFLIIFSHIGIYTITSIAFIASSVLSRKYVRSFLLPISFLQFLFSYKYYLSSLYNMCTYLAKNHCARTTHGELDITLFAHMNFLFFLITAWALSLQIYSSFKNSITIFSPSKVK